MLVGDVLYPADFSWRLGPRLARASSFQRDLLSRFILARRRRMKSERVVLEQSWIWHRSKPPFVMRLLRMLALVHSLHLFVSKKQWKQYHGDSSLNKRRTDMLVPGGLSVLMKMQYHTIGKGKRWITWHEQKILTAYSFGCCHSMTLVSR